MAKHNVVSEPVWWGNGSVGREIRCVTCDPNRLLWQSPQYGEFDATEEFLAEMAKDHQAEFPQEESEPGGGWTGGYEPGDDGPADDDHPEPPDPGGIH